MGWDEDEDEDEDGAWVKEQQILQVPF